MSDRTDRQRCPRVLHSLMATIVVASGDTALVPPHLSTPEASGLPTR